MTHREIHKLLDELPWEDVESLMEQDDTIRSHISQCDACRLRETKVQHGRLASRGGMRRSLIETGAQRLADLFRMKPQ